MSQHTYGVFRASALRLVVAVALVSGVFVLWSQIRPAYALGGEIPIGHEQANSRPAIAYCGDTPYIAWIGTDSHHSLNFGWPLPSSNQDFANKIFMNSTTTSMEDPSGSVEAGPALACYNNGTGAQLWTAYVGANNHIYVGWFQLPGNGGGRYLHQDTDTGEQTPMSPALAVYGSALYLAFKGLPNNYLYYKGSPNGYTWSGSGVIYFHITTETASAGLGLIDFTPTGSAPSGLWTAWPGTDVDGNGNVHLNIAFVYITGQSLEDKLTLTNKTVDGYSAALAASNYYHWLYLPNSGDINDVEVAESQNTTQWGTVQLGGASVYGVSGGIQPNNLLSLTWFDDLGDMWYLTDYNFTPAGQ